MNDPGEKLAGWTAEDHLAFDIGFALPGGRYGGFGEHLRKTSGVVLPRRLWSTFGYAAGSFAYRSAPLGTERGGAASPPERMCGRVIQASGPLRLAIVDGLDVRDSRLTNVPRRYNAAPNQDLLVIRQNHQTGERSLDFLKWGLVPYWCKDPKGDRKPINAKAETASRLPMFRDAYARRRCILPIDGFFEWKAIKGQKARQPYAIAMKDGSPFGIAGLWENWKDPTSGEWVRTFTIITVPANELVSTVHDRMPAILHREDFDRWLGPESDPHGLLQPFPSEPLRIWPISTRVNSPMNDDEHVLDEVDLPANAA